MLDLNDANEQRQDGIIPDGTFVKIVAHIRPGGIDGDDLPTDKGILTASKSSDALMLDFEFTVLHGPHAKRKIWQLMTVKGGKTDEKGISKAWNITKDTIRAMVDSACGLDPKDKSDATQLKRRLPGFAVLNDLAFVAKIGVEFGGDYPDKNKIARVVVPSDAEWQTVMQGGEVAAKPTGRAAPRANGHAMPPQQQQLPAWQQTPTPTPSTGWGQAQPGVATTVTPAQPGSAGPAWLRGQQ